MNDVLPVILFIATAQIGIQYFIAIVVAQAAVNDVVCKLKESPPKEEQDMTNPSIRTIADLQDAVSNWSLMNFGQQISKADGRVLGSISPLLGMAEELGEFEAAGDIGEKEDALADILIYGCDFAAREATYLDDAILTADPGDFDGDADSFRIGKCVRHLGRLYHCVLKRHQGIRGFDDYQYYKENRDDALGAFFISVSELANELQDRNNSSNRSLFQMGRDTFLEVISKRDWNKDPEGTSHDNT